jgi:hypothetical protein
VKSLVKNNNTIILKERKVYLRKLRELKTKRRHLLYRRCVHKSNRYIERNYSNSKKRALLIGSRL